MKYHLTELFDIEELKRLCESFTKLNGTVTAILDLEGNVHIATGWQSICTRFHRINNETKRLCTESDTILAGQLNQGQKYNVYKCKNGLVDIAMPIMVGDTHVGNFFTGQFFIEKPDIDFFRKQVQKYNFNENDYLSALEKVPIFNENQIKATIEFLVQLTETIGNIGLKNLNNLNIARQLEIEKNNLKKINEEYASLIEEYKIQNEDLQQAKEKTEQSEIEYKSLIENINIGIFQTTLDGKFFLANSSIVKMSGYDNVEEFLTVPSQNLYADNLDRDFMINELREKGFNKNREIRSIKKNGDIYWISMNSVIIKDSFGKPISLLGAIEDITERKQAEKAQCESEQRLSTIIDFLPDATFAIDKDKRVIIWNKAIEKMTSIPAQEMIGKGDYAYTIPFYGVARPQLMDLFWVPDHEISKKYPNLKSEDDNLVIEVFCPALHGGKGAFVWAKASPLRDSDGHLIGAIECVRDITKQKQAEKALLESKQLLTQIIEFLPDATFAIDKEGKIIAWNHAIEEMTGAKAVDMLGKGNHEHSLPFYSVRRPILIDHLFLPVDEIKKHYHSISKEGEIIMAEADLHLKGEVRSIWGKAAPLYDSLNNIIGGIEAVRDTTERKKAELQIKEKNDEYLALNEELNQKNNEYYSLNEEYKTINRELNYTNEELKIAKEKAEESDRLKTVFLHNISHEIRTPMNAIIGFSGFLDDPDLSNEKRKYFTSIIQNSSHQLLSIVTDILTISTLQTKQEKLNIKPVCINNIISDLLTVFKTQAIIKNISLCTKPQLTDKQAEIYTDNIKVTQILTNLISNALKFTHEGFVEFGYSLKDNELEFYVKDGGIGIKTEMHEKIFERFRQANETIHVEYGGTGLGLSISKGFVELLGGKIWVQSEFEKGSTFYFTIPYKPVHEIKKTDLILKQIENGKRLKTILVAEDDEYNYLFIAELLTDMKIQLIHSKDGKETVDICKTNPNIDLIFMDIKMPIMDGYVAAKLIKEFRPDLPIIAQTAYALEQEKEKYRGTTFDGYITKPINKVELNQILMKYIAIEKDK